MTTNDSSVLVDEVVGFVGELVLGQILDIEVRIDAFDAFLAIELFCELDDSLFNEDHFCNIPNRRSILRIFM